MKSKRHFIVAIGIACAVLVVSLVGYAVFSAFFGQQEGAKADDGRPTAAESGRRNGKRAHGAPAKGRRASASGRRLVLVDDEFEGMDAADRRLAEAVQKAMDSDDHGKIIAASAKALASANPKVRLEAVEALGWCGKDALAELTGVLADPDDDVRDIAINNWECALAEEDSPKLRYSVALSVMGTITNPDAIDSISGQFGSAAQEYIDETDDESEQSKRRVEVVQQLVDIIEGGSQICSEKAKEAFDDLTGHKWLGVEEAEKYLANPDDYDPPEEKE